MSEESKTYLPLDFKRGKGRPSKKEDARDPARQYVDGEWEKYGCIPTIEGCSCFCGITRETFHVWAREDKYFSDIAKEIATIQGHKLLHGGLSGEFKERMSMFVLSAKHGFVEKNQTDGRQEIIIRNAPDLEEDAN